MNYKKIVFATFLTSALFISGCTDKEDEVVKKTPDETVEEKPSVTEEVTDSDKDSESEPVIDENNENSAVLVFSTYFDGITEEDITKISSVYNNETALASYEDLFETLNVTANVMSYEVLSQDENVWEFDVKVEFSSEDENTDYTENVTTYLIKVDSSTGKIIFLETLATEDL